MIRLKVHSLDIFLLLVTLSVNSRDLLKCRYVFGEEWRLRRVLGLIYCYLLQVHVVLRVGVVRHPSSLIFLPVRVKDSWHSPGSSRRLLPSGPEGHTRRRTVVCSSRMSFLLRTPVALLSRDNFRNDKTLVTYIKDLHSSSEFIWNKKRLPFSNFS